MTALSRKAQVVLAPEQYALLESYAREQGKAVSTLLREVLERTILAELEQREREAALEWFKSQSLPVSDWPTMEREIESMYSECPP